MVGMVEPSTNYSFLIHGESTCQIHAESSQRLIRGYFPKHYYFLFRLFYGMSQQMHSAMGGIYIFISNIFSYW